MLENWCSRNHLTLEGDKDSVLKTINGKLCLVKSVVKNRIFFEDITFRFSSSEKEIIRDYEEVEYVVYEFGYRWYWDVIDRKAIENRNRQSASFNDLKYFGDFKAEREEFYNLGIHTNYELLNGSGSLKEYAERAKYFGISGLGICDLGTMGGTLAFQTALSKTDIKSIQGASYDILTAPDQYYTFKFYVKNEEGWRNLLRLNKIYNFTPEGERKHIKFNSLKKYSGGLWCVLSTNSPLLDPQLKKGAKKLIANRLKKFRFLSVFQQVDTVEFSSPRRDNIHLRNLAYYYNHFSTLIDPILINDSYYIDKEYSQLKKYYNSLSNNNESESETQFLKTYGESKEILSSFFEEGVFANGADKMERLRATLENPKIIGRGADYEISTGIARMPSFKHAPEFEDSEEQFFSLLEEGVKTKLKKGGKLKKKSSRNLYYERIEKEVTLIVGAGFVDYFLILWDVLEFCKREDIEYGVGRGSVGGCLVAYLLDIIKIDPIEYDLLFERFMNEARVSGERAKSADALPDIDLDFEAGRREEVKQYIVRHYGENQVSYVGTYTTMKVKGGLKDLGRVDGLSFNRSNYISSLIRNEVKPKWEYLFRDANEGGKTDLKNFIQENPSLINLIRFSLKNPKASSIHASALIITPEFNEKGERMEVWDWYPVRKEYNKETGTSVIVSEWEGEYLERAGFLKEDILGLTQLDKFMAMKRLIKKEYGEKVNLLEIPLENEGTFNLFREGVNEGVFQFHTSGMKKYCRMVKPDTVEELIAMNALYRPGPMRSNAHTDFALIKKGRKKPSYDFMLKEVTKKTYGLYVFQEQIMQATHILGNLTLVDADNLRTAIKKFDAEKMDKYEKKFLEGAVTNGLDRKGAVQVWSKLQRFSGYGFNRSHSAAYSLMGYWSQWFKSTYPLVFWTVSIQNAKDDDLDTFLGEKEKHFPEIIISPPEINNSDLDFRCDINRSTIFWSLLKIKGVGEKTASSIILERKENGPFRSIEDFLERMKGKRAGRGVVESLIISGSFDELYDIDKENVKDRIYLLMHLYELCKVEWPDKYEELRENYHWTILQQELSALGEIPFKELIRNFSPKMAKKYTPFSDLQYLEPSKGKQIVIAGVLTTFYVNTSKKGTKYGKITLKNNFDFFNVLMWSDGLEVYKKDLEDAKKLGKIVAFSASFSYEDGEYTFFTSSASRVLFI